MDFSKFNFSRHNMQIFMDIYACLCILNMTIQILINEGTSIGIHRSIGRYPDVGLKYDGANLAGARIGGMNLFIVQNR